MSSIFVRISLNAQINMLLSTALLVFDIIFE